jgi:hypothetical protein
MSNAHSFRTVKENSMFKLNKIAALGLMAVGMTFVGCMEQTSSTAPQANTSKQGAVMSVRVGLDPVNALAKSATISLKKLILVLSTNDTTIRDTITTSTTPALSATSTLAQIISKGYTLKPLRVWKLVATTKDNLDSVIHMDSVTTGELFDGDTAKINLTLSSHFSMYQAQFLIPDSISSTLTGLKQIVNINRIVLKVDGNTVRDSTVVGSTYFTPKVNALLNYDYITVGSHNVILLAYGPMITWNAANALYTSASTPINVAAGVDSTIAITLNWTGPTTNSGTVTATIGKVGTVIINGTLPGSVIP